MPCTDNVGKYLGFYLLHRGRNTKTPKELMLKARNKMAGWKLKCLSKAVYITLAYSILNALPDFYMRLMKILDETHKDSRT